MRAVTALVSTVIWAASGSEEVSDSAGFVQLETVADAARLLEAHSVNAFVDSNGAIDISKFEDVDDEDSDSIESPTTTTMTTATIAAATATAVTSQGFCKASVAGSCQDASNGQTKTYGKCGVTQDDCGAICDNNTECIGFTLWHDGRCWPACFIHVPGFDQSTTPNVDADREANQGGSPRRRGTRRREWGFGGSSATTITKGSGDSRATCTFKMPAPSTLNIAMAASVVSGCGSTSTSELRMNECTSTRWDLSVGCLIGQGGSITLTFLSDESGSRDKSETMEVLVDGEVVGTVFNSGCNPDTCTATVPWSAAAQTLEVVASSATPQWRSHMSMKSMVFVAGEERWCVGACGTAASSAPACSGSTIPRPAPAQSADGRLHVHTLCLPENLAGPAVSNLPMRSPLMYATAVQGDITQKNVVYFSWTADRPYGNQESDGRVYITKLKISEVMTPSAPSIQDSVHFDGFVRNGGIDITETGVVGTLCAKYVPAWMEKCSPNPYRGYCAYALAVCEASVVNGGLTRRGKPWRIGKQYAPHNSGTNGLDSSIGKNGAYTHQGTGGQTAGYGYLTYSPSTGSASGRWSTWYGASWGSHSGYAMHTYEHDAPQAPLSQRAGWENNANVDNSLLLDESQIQSRVEDFGPTDHHRLGTGDHQAGSAWNYNTALGDIGLLKHTHGGVYMQQYGLADSGATLVQTTANGDDDTTVGAQSFQPTGKHSVGRVYLYKTTNGVNDTAVQEGGLRQCGSDHWVLALNSDKGGNLCAKVHKDGTLVEWKVIDSSTGGWRGNKMMRIASLGVPHATSCDDTTRFLYGFEKSSDESRWLVEVDGNCNTIEDTLQEVTAHTTWPIYQDWVTTSEGAVVWVTAWRQDQVGAINKYFPAKSCSFPTADANGYQCSTTAGTLKPFSEESNWAKVTTYYPSSLR